MSATMHFHRTNRIVPSSRKNCTTSAIKHWLPRSNVKRRKNAEKILLPNVLGRPRTDNGPDLDCRHSKVSDNNNFPIKFVHFSEINNCVDLTDEPSTPDDQQLYDNETEEKKRLAKEEKERAAKEFEENLLAQERKKYIRPWDKGKDKTDDDDGGEWEYKPEREPMSQAEWNEKKRAERNAEFAPVADSKSKVNPFKHKVFSTPPPPLPEPPVKHFQQYSSTTPQLKRKPFVRRPIDDECPPPGVDPSEYGHIENELSDTDDQDAADGDDRKRCAIPPPPTFEYYGPTSSKQRKPNAQTPQNIETSIAAGLKFLREQSDKGMPGTKMKWSSNVDY